MATPTRGHLYLIRGLPGSGKTTFAKSLVGSWIAEEHFEADMYFNMFNDGSWNGALLREAHAWCFESTKRALESKAYVVVSNTFTTLKELSPYIELAKVLDVPVTVIHMEGNHGSVHGVPPETYEKMKKRWENYDGLHSVG